MIIKLLSSKVTPTSSTIYNHTHHSPFLSIIMYQLTTESLNYTRTEVIAQSEEFEPLEKLFHELLGQCLMESVIGNNDVDYVCIELLDNDEVIDCHLDYTFNEPK